MVKSHKHSCTFEIGAEVLMVITSFIILLFLTATSFQGIVLQYNYSHFSMTLIGKVVDIVLSPIFALFLPLLSYMFSQAQENNPARAQVILIWVVLSEVIRISVGSSTWELKRSAEQLVRLVWVGYLVYSFKPLNFLRASLLVLSVLSIISEVLKGITRYQADDSYLLGKNPKLIHDYMNRVMLQDDFKTTPMSSCDYIVMGEENHEIVICKKGYHLGGKKSNSEAGMLTIGRVFGQLNSPNDEAFTSVNPDWRDTCLSFALAKMLRRRFVNLSLDEAGSSKALQFVQEGLIDYIGSNKDLPPERRNGERNPERVFDIMRDELKFVSELLQTKVPTSHYFRWTLWVDYVGSWIMIVILFYLVWYSIPTIYPRWDSTLPSLNLQVSAYANCSSVGYAWLSFDKIVVALLAASSYFIEITRSIVVTGSKRWNTLKSVKLYLKNPAKLHKAKKSALPGIHRKLYCLYCLSDINNVEQVGIHNSIFAIKGCPKVPHTLGKWIRKTIPRIFFRTVTHSSDVKEAILISLTNSHGQLTNGETALEKYHRIFERFYWVYRPSGRNTEEPNRRTTEAILVWHIATTLFHHQKPPHQQNNDPLKERWVALDLSNYCLHLLVHLPDLLPDEAEWTEETIESVREEIYAIDGSSGQKPTAINRCNYASRADITWDEKSVVGKGAKLAKELVDYAEKSVVGKGAKLAKELVDYADEEILVWRMLSEFWAEMMLFIAPSDNVKGHEEILEKGELITQLWALLTHAGILSRPKSTEHPNHGIESTEMTEDMNV